MGNVLIERDTMVDIADSIRGKTGGVELMKPDDAVPLTCMFNGEKLPVIYCLEEDSIYGMTKDVFFQRLKELFDILKDEERSREMGIRSANGTVNHFVMNSGDVYDISVEATGGLTVHKKMILD